MTPKKRVAAIVTEYRIRSHADNIVTRLLEGYELHWELVPPRLEVASLYTDQVPENDISRELAARHGVPIFPTIREALTLGGDGLAVDGVVIVGEHGSYPFNEKQQRQYPRRRFFEETVDVFRQSGRVVPVFNDKHLAYNWADAKWMYDTAQALGIPFMAGSSMPLSHRSPPMQVPFGAEIEEAVVVAHGGIESYGFHALEIAQCLVERRKGHETGVAAVQCLTGDAFWEAVDRGGLWSAELEAAALGVNTHGEAATARAHYAQARAQAASGATGSRPATGEREPNEPAIYLVEYRDGLRVTVLMYNGYARQRSVAVRVKGRAAPLATWFLQARLQPLWHFCNQVDYIERMVESGQAPFPLERTLLTTGTIDAVMTSRHEGGRRLETPHLGIAYQLPTPPRHHEVSILPQWQQG